MASESWGRRGGGEYSFDASFVKTQRRDFLGTPFSPFEVLQCEADTNEIFELASDRLEELELLLFVTTFVFPCFYVGQCLGSRCSNNQLTGRCQRLE